MKIDFWRIVNDFMREGLSLTSGKYRTGRKERALFEYETSIEWKNGLPYKVSCSVDFSPSKNIIIKKEEK